MIKQFSNDTCAFDCEWVPCATTGRRLLNLDHASSEVEVFRATWERHRAEDEEGRRRDDNNGEGEVARRPFLKLAMSRVISIAAILRQKRVDGTVKLQLYARHIGECSEGELIGDFLERVARNNPEKGWQLWGFNSVASGLPVLKQRAIALGVSCPKFSMRPEKP